MVLSGTRDLRTLVNLDPQLSRRLIPIEFTPLDAAADGGSVRMIIAQYAGSASISVSPEVLEPDFTRRLVHAAAEEMGLAIELVIAGIEEALLHNEQSLGIEAFRRAFGRRAGCSDAWNPIVAADWRSIDPRKLLEQTEGDVLNLDSVRRRRS